MDIYQNNYVGQKMGYNKHVFILLQYPISKQINVNSQKLKKQQDWPWFYNETF